MYCKRNKHKCFLDISREMRSVCAGYWITLPVNHLKKGVNASVF